MIVRVLLGMAALTLLALFLFLLALLGECGSDVTPQTDAQRRSVACLDVGPLATVRAAMAILTLPLFCAALAAAGLAALRRGRWWWLAAYPLLVVVWIGTYFAVGSVQPDLPTTRVESLRFLEPSCGIASAPSCADGLPLEVVLSEPSYLSLRLDRAEEKDEEMLDARFVDREAKDVQGADAPTGVLNAYELPAGNTVLRLRPELIINPNLTTPPPPRELPLGQAPVPPDRYTVELEITPVGGIDRQVRELEFVAR